MTLSRHESIFADHVYLVPPWQNRSIDSRNLRTERKRGRKAESRRGLAYTKPASFPVCIGMLVRAAFWC